MHLWHDVPAGENPPENITVIIEVPQGSQNKYEIIKETGLIALDRVLYGANFYPANYGFIPQTYWDDGDALDAFVLTTNPLFSGCVVQARPIAVIEMIDSGESDDKLICVPNDDPRFSQIKDLDDIPPHIIKEMKHFFETYKMLQGKEVHVETIHKADKAKEAVLKGIDLYKKKFGDK